MNIVGREHFLGHIALVDIDMRPLPALRLVTGHRIGIFYLQRVEIRVGLEFFYAVALSRNVSIVGSTNR